MTEVILTILAETSRSDSVQVPVDDLDGFAMPVAWDRAPLTFRISQDGVTFTDALNPDGSVVQVEVIPGTYLVSPFTGMTTGATALTVVSGLPDDPVYQTQDREFKIYSSASAKAKKGAPKQDESSPKHEPSRHEEDDHKAKRK